MTVDGVRSISLPATVTTTSAPKSTVTTTTTTTEIMFSVSHMQDMVSVFRASTPMPTTSTTTTTTKTLTSTTTFLPNSDTYIDIEKIRIPLEPSLSSSKISVIVFISVVSLLACGLFVWALLKYLKKKNICFVNVVVSRQNEEVVVPDCETQSRGACPKNEQLPASRPENERISFSRNRIDSAPTVTIRQRIHALSRYFIFLDRASQYNNRRFRRQQQQQQQQEQYENIELGDIESVFPDFRPFPGFNLAEFRMLVAAFCKPRIENDPDRVFYFFPTEDCLD